MNAHVFYAYNRLRSLQYFTEYNALKKIGCVIQAVTGEKPTPAKKGRLAELKLLNEHLHNLFMKDAENIASGIYPLQVLKPEAWTAHAARIPRLIFDGVGLVLRRTRKETRNFDQKAKHFADQVPEYYQRNFHYQTNGYLSDRSAELYEHQVEMLFAGAADAMRRLAIPPLKKHFKNSDGEGLHFLEVAAGTGRATRFLKVAFPKARITLLDLSGPYLKLAQKKLSEFDGLNFIEGRAEALNFKDESFDAVVSVFLFHELPEEVRVKVMKESRRVLKKGGFLGAVDSIQLGDLPEFSQVLHDFPSEFHEPYYPNYIRHPLEEIILEPNESAKGSRNNVSKEIGLLSKVVYATK